MGEEPTPAGATSMPFAPHLLPFYASIALGVIFVALAGLGATEGDVDLDGAVDTELGAEVEAELEGDADVEPNSSWVSALLGVLGVGRVPTMSLLVLILLAFGTAGLLLDRLARHLHLDGILHEAFLVGAAAVAALLVASTVSRLLGHVLPSRETWAEGPERLVGQVGRAILPVDADGGVVALHDETGTLHEIHCRVDGVRLPKGAEVVVTDYDEASRTHTVAPLEL